VKTKARPAAQSTIPMKPALVVKTSWPPDGAAIGSSRRVWLPLGR
jgi:hypothetical protein